MEDIKEIINKVIGDLAEKKPDVHNKVERVWQNLLNGQELKHTKLVGINEGTLSVFVDSPAWLYQMRIRQTKILKQLKEDAPDIKYIQFKIGKIK
jgi:predicted nucleic acid-binding Zn ribbon protein